MADGLDLGKKVGPMPLGAWLLVVAGGLGLAYYINRRQGGGAAVPVTEDQLTAEPGVGTGGGQFIYEPPTTITPATAETLDEWIIKAIAYLASLGKNPLDAQRALTKWRDGQTLTPDEAALVNLAFAIGAPPELPSTASGVTPPPSPTTAPKYALTATIPGSRRAGARITIRGRLTKDGKNPGVSVVTVKYRRSAGDSWKWLKYVPTFTTGAFTAAVTLPTRHSCYVAVTGPGGTIVSRYVKST